MRDGLERISRLVERLGRFARGSSSDTLSGPVDLCAVAERAGALAGVGLPCGAIRTRLESARPVQANEDALVQIATNLLVNAIQASGDSPDIEVEVHPDAAGVALIVHDRGPGIPEDVLPNIFDPFFTTKRPGEGTGLGLSLSFDLARRYGGTLRAAPRPGGGASFTLWRPASADGSA
jgi:signal transduction histidine kinase